ncbi:MAG: hypothetical protein MUE85_21380 [Microscillaceae bacterium]|jgi:hypothetical protein|nr:hypothetical protein [Microscillaceae bacterium]
MNEWWEALSFFEKFLWVIAPSASLVFLIQTGLSFLGFDHSHHEIADSRLDMTLSDYGDAGITSQKQANQPKLWNIKNGIIFLMVFGWTSIVGLNRDLSPVLSALLGGGLGYGTMYGWAWMFSQLLKQTADGTLDLNRAIGVEGEVYLTIPAHERGTGKITVVVQGQLCELDAKTSGEQIATGKKIQVIALLENDILLVEETV